MSIYDDLNQLDQQSSTEKEPPGTESGDTKHTSKPARESTRKPAREMDPSREMSSEKPREELRGTSRDIPSRDEIQKFSFSLRDELKVKVQAEVPHQWQDELDRMARKLNVKKLELYRYILGDFLGKVKH